MDTTNRGGMQGNAPAAGQQKLPQGGHDNIEIPKQSASEGKQQSSLNLFIPSELFPFLFLPEACSQISNRWQDVAA